MCNLFSEAVVRTSAQHDPNKSLQNRSETVCGRERTEVGMLPEGGTHKKGRSFTQCATLQSLHSNDIGREPNDRE